MKSSSDPVEGVYTNYRLRMALSKFPGISVTSDQELLNKLSSQAASNFRMTGHFLCPDDPVKSALLSPKPLGDLECPCIVAVGEATKTGTSSCGLLKARVTKLAPDLKEKLHVLQNTLRSTRPKPSDQGPGRDSVSRQ